MVWGGIRAVVLGVALASCGAGDRLAPYSAPPPECRSVDGYLEDLYAVVDAGGVSALAGAIRERIPDETRRDLVDALLRLLSSFQEGRFTDLTGVLAARADDGPGLQQTLGAVVRYLAGRDGAGPDLAMLAMLREASATCSGEALFGLLAELTDDPDLVPALLSALSSDTLAGLLADLSFEGQGGRRALQLLVRNLLVSAGSETFDVEGLLGLLEVVLGDAADDPPLGELVAGVRRVFARPGALASLRETLSCLRAVDDELALGGFVYDLVTSGLAGDVAGAPIELPEAVLALLRDALEHLRGDAVARRALKATLVALLAQDVAPPVLSDVATLLEAEALTGVVELVVDVASGACKVRAGAP